jgi:hypothetical protein
MPVAASQVFEFLERQKVGTVERHEIALAAFGTLRRSLRQIALKLCDSDDQEALSVSNQLRVLLCEWLTVPVPFDRSMLRAVEDLLGRSEAVHARWGSDTGALYDMALRAAENLPSLENPLREKLRAVIRELRSQGRNLKIYCHRRARQHFESLLSKPEDAPISEDAFLHSLRDYCETEPFDALIKVGPLRIRGWGSAPDALLTAPRFGTLCQIVWSGCNDDPNFGYDPVLPPTVALTTNGTASVVPSITRHGPMEWSTHVTRSGVDNGAVSEYANEADELRIFRGTGQPFGKRSATLVQVDEKHGILYPPHSKVLSFDPSSTAGEPISLRTPGETLVEGMYVITPSVGEVDLGGLQAEQGQYSQIWRERLEQEWRDDAKGLIKRLQAAGLKLVNLNSAIRHWCEPPGTVIHAPQLTKHFEILLRVLGLDRDVDSSPGQKRTLLFWQRAWNEVRRSRGQAIQTGFQEHELLEEQLLVTIKNLIPEIREKILATDGCAIKRPSLVRLLDETASVFQLPVPVGAGIKGRFVFRKVYGIEEGFSAPETELKVVRELNLIDQWRD